MGRDRIQVIHGTKDNLITVPHAHVLADGLGGEKQGITKVMFEGKGHGIPAEMRQELNDLVAALIEKSEKLG